MVHFITNRNVYLTIVDEILTIQMYQKNYTNYKPQLVTDALTRDTRHKNSMFYARLDLSQVQTRY